LYMVEQVRMICKIAVGGCARQLQREMARFEAGGQGWREGGQGILGQAETPQGVNLGHFSGRVFCQQRKRIAPAKCVVETDGSVEKPKNGFPTEP
jgi:hypothetical protein